MVHHNESHAKIEKKLRRVVRVVKLERRCSARGRGRGRSCLSPSCRLKCRVEPGMAAPGPGAGPGAQAGGGGGGVVAGAVVVSSGAPPDVDGGVGGVGGPGPHESPTKLIVNYIPEVMTQPMMYSLFAAMGKLESCKLIANRGYGFVEYADAEDATKAQKAFDGLLMQNKTLKVSHALLNPEAKPPTKPEADWNLYMCNLPDEMTLQDLHGLFGQFGRIVNSRVAAGIAFVLYETQAEAERAIRQMNGAAPDGFAQPLTVKYANKSSGGRSRHGGGAGSGGARSAIRGWYPHEHAPVVPSAAHWAIYVYNLATDVEELTLWQLFGPYGAIVSVRIIRDHQSNKSRGFGFVTMRNFDQAALAIQELNGYSLMGQPLSVSFKTHKR